MKREELHAHIQSFAQENNPSLEESVLTKWVLLGEFLVPGDDMAFHRMSGQRDGRALIGWDVDGLLVTGLLRGRSDLKEL